MANDLSLSVPHAEQSGWNIELVICKSDEV